MRFWFIVALITVIALLSITLPITAQTDLECSGGESLADAIRFDMSPVPEDGLVIVTVIGLEGFDPVLGLIYEDGFADCVYDDPGADGYGATLPSTGTVDADVTSTQVLIDSEDGIVGLAVIGYQETSGDFLLMVEGLTFAGAEWAMTVSPTANYALNAYLLAADATLNPALTILTAGGSPLTDGDGAPIQCDDAGTETCWGDPLALSGASIATFDGEFMAAANSAVLHLPDDVMVGDAITISARSQSGTAGTGILALHVMQATGAGVFAAQWSTAERGAALVCDGVTLFDNGVVVTFPPTVSDNAYTVTAVGLNAFNPALGIFTGDAAAGACYRPDRNGANVGINLPTTGEIVTSAGTVRAVIAPEVVAQGVTMVIGDETGAGGEFAIMIEGGAVAQTDTAPFGARGIPVVGDGLSIGINDSLLESGVFLISYMIATEDGFDPLIMRLTPDGNFMDDIDGLPIACDDSGREDLCWGTGEDLSNASVMLADGASIAAFYPDAMLRLPLDDVQAGDGVYLLLSSSNMETFGAYVIVLQLGTS